MTPVRETPYAPFWPLLGLLLASMIRQGAYVADDLSQRRRLEWARGQVAQEIAPAMTLNQNVQAVSHDLIVLAVSSSEAATLVADFGLRPSSAAGAP